MKIEAPKPLEEMPARRPGRSICPPELLRACAALKDGEYLPVVCQDKAELSRVSQFGYGRGALANRGFKSKIRGMAVCFYRVGTTPSGMEDA